MSAIDLNADGTRLTSMLALNWPDREELLVKYGEEIERLLAYSFAAPTSRRAITLSSR